MRRVGWPCTCRRRSYSEESVIAERNKFSSNARVLRFPRERNGGGSGGNPRLIREALVSLAKQERTSASKKIRPKNGRSLKKNISAMAVSRQLVEEGGKDVVT